MKIVTSKEFLELPENTVFCEHEHDKFTPLAIKMKTEQDGRFSYQEMTGTFYFKRPDLDHELEYDTSFHIVCYDIAKRDQIYCVYDRDDVVELINRLMEAL